MTMLSRALAAHRRPPYRLLGTIGSSESRDAARAEPRSVSRIFQPSLASRCLRTIYCVICGTRHRLRL